MTKEKINLVKRNIKALRKGKILIYSEMCICLNENKNGGHELNDANFIGYRSFYGFSSFHGLRKFLRETSLYSP